MRGSPGGIVEAGGIPTVLFSARVVFLAVEFVVRADRSLVGDFPRAIAHHRFGRAIGIVQPELEQEFGKSKGLGRGRGEDARGKKASIAEQHTDRVGAVPHVAGDIKGHHHRVLIITTQRGIHHQVVADLPAVDRQLKKPEPADRGGGAFQRAGGGEFAAQHAGWQPPVFVFVHIPPWRDPGRAERTNRHPRAVIAHAGFPSGFLLVRRAPCGVGADNQRLAVQEFHPRFQENAGRLAWLLAGIVRDFEREHIGSRPQEPGDIGFRAEGETHSVHRFFPVHPQHELARREQIDAGPEEPAVRRQFERAAEIPGLGWQARERIPLRMPDPTAAGKPLARLHAAIHADPFPPPVIRSQQAHRPMRRFAPWRNPAGLVPDADFPPAELFRDKRPPRISDVNRLIGLHFARVPAIALIQF